MSQGQLGLFWLGSLRGSGAIYSEDQMSGEKRLSYIYDVSGLNIL